MRGIRGLRSQRDALLGATRSLPVAGITGPPFADALDVIGAFEVIGVGLLREPGPLAGALADGPTFGLSTEALPTAVTPIRGKRGPAMQAIRQRRQTGHSREEDAQASETEAAAESGRRRRRRKKSCRCKPKKTPPRRPSPWWISNRWNQTNFRTVATSAQVTAWRLSAGLWPGGNKP